MSTNEFASVTADYAAEIERSVTLLQAVYDGYGDGEPYRERVEEVRASESECDRYHRRIHHLLADSKPEDFGLLGSRLYMNRSDILRLYDSLDEVANRAEEAASNVVTMGPPRDDRLSRQFSQLAENSVRAVAELEKALTVLTQHLRTPNDSGAVGTHIRRVREIESAADERRNRTVAAAFDSDIDDPLVVRAIARDLDSVLDAIEDTADQVAVVASAEPGLAVSERSE